MREKIPVLQDDVDKVFGSGKVYNAPDQLLLEYLRVLCTGSVANEMVRHRETNRCVTINTLMNMRLINKIDRTNTILIVFSIILAITGVVTSIIQVIK